LVVVFDCSEHSGNIVDGDAGGDTPRRDTDAVADEQVAITPGDVVEVDLTIERSTDGSHGD
jgi:hypothetical protein